MVHILHSDVVTRCRERKDYGQKFAVARILGRL